MKTVIENPAPLNPFPAWPYTVTPFPTAWLLSYTTLGDVPQDTKPDENSLESWN
jgi:hypothetical protein